MGMSDLRIVSDVPAGSHLVEISIEELAKRLGLEEVDVPLLMRSLEDTVKNLTVGDVHATTSLKDVTVAYIQGDDDGSKEEDDEQETEKADEQDRDDHGRFAGSHNAASQAHLGALTAAGTDRPKFEAAHAALSSDKGVTNAGLRAIASTYGSGHVHASGATRQHMLDELRRNFTARARFESKVKGGEVVFDLNVTKADPDQRKIFGWASVCAFDGKLVVDKQDDIIHVADLERAAHDFTLYSRTQGDMHSDIGVGRLIESVIFDQAKRDAGIIARDDQGRVIDGWWVGFYVDDDSVWASHKRGERPEFSIGGRAQREPV